MLIAHTSDAHIDHTTHAVTPAQRQAALLSNFTAYASTVTGAVERGADVFVHAGDAFAHGRPSPEAMMLFVEATKPVLDAGIPVVLIEGNHERLRHRSGQRTATVVLAEMLAQYGEVHHVDRGSELVRTGNGLQVGCLPWVDTFDMLRDADRLGQPEFVQNQFIADETVNLLARLCEQADTSSPLMMTTHLAVSSAVRGSERDLTMLFREPVVSGAALADLPAAYTALGHIHAPQELATGIWYSGSPQRFTFTDEPDTKVWNLVDISGDNELRSVESIPTTARDFQTIDLNEKNPAEPRPNAFVRLRLPMGEAEAPQSILDAVEAVQSRVVTTVREKALVNVSDVEADGATMDETVDAAEALLNWLATNYPDADAKAVAKLAAELETN